MNVYLMGNEKRLIDAGGQPGQCRNQEGGMEEQRHGSEMVWTRAEGYPPRLSGFPPQLSSVSAPGLPCSTISWRTRNTKSGVRLL